MALITKTEELKAFVAVDKNLSPESIAPSVASAERDYVLPALGQTLLSALQAAYTASLPPTNTPLATAMANLLPKVQAVLANLGYANYIEGIGTIRVSDSGVTSSVGEKQKTPFKWQMDQTKAYHTIEGLKSVDALLAFLEANVADYADWKNSPQYTLYKGTLLHTTDQVEAHYPLQGSRQAFLLLRPSIRHIEETTITDLLGYALYDSLILKQQNSTAFNGLETRVVKLCREATVWLAIQMALPQLLHKFSELGIVQPGVEGQLDSGDVQKPAPMATVLMQGQHAERRGQEALKRLRKLLSENADTLSWTEPDAPKAIDYNEGIEGGIIMV